MSMNNSRNQEAPTIHLTDIQQGSWNIKYPLRMCILLTCTNSAVISGHKELVCFTICYNDQNPREQRMIVLIHTNDNSDRCFPCGLLHWVKNAFISILKRNAWENVYTRKTLSVLQWIAHNKECCNLQMSLTLAPLLGWSIAQTQETTNMHRILMWKLPGMWQISKMKS